MKNERQVSAEQQRALLRKAWNKNPSDRRVLRALRQSLHPKYIHRAVRQGIFISYSPADALFALELTTSLQEVGAKVWMDEISTPPGVDWQDAVKMGLRDNGLMALVITPDALQNASVRAEYRYFLAMGKIVQPLLVRGDMQDIPELHLKPIDFRGGFLEGMDQMMSVLGLDAAAQG
jgi:hypothetical protein